MYEADRPITGEFESAVERLNTVTGDLYNATFEDIGQYHGAIVSAMAALYPFAGWLPEAIDAWYIAEDSDGNEGEFPTLDEPYGDALANVIDHFNGLRNNLGRVTAYVHSYNEFHNSLGDLVSYCRRWDYERGIFVS